MKFRIDKKELSLLTSTVSRAASGKSTIPVLTGLHISADKENGLTMTATDMEIGIKASHQDVEIITEGEVLVNAGYFDNYIKLLPDGPIDVALNEESSRLVISYGRSTGKINIYDEKEYPGLPISRAQSKISIQQKILKEALRKTVFASAVNHFRQVFTGVLFDFKGAGEVRIVASDTHRMAYYNYMSDQKDVEPFHFVIPSRTVNELLRFLDDDDENVDISLSDNNVIFSNARFLLVSRLIEGQYPNYEQVIPSNIVSNAFFNTHSLFNALERARVMPTDDKIKIPHVQLSFNENEACINSYSEVMGDISDVLEDISLAGDKDIKIAFNTNYFLDIVRIMEAECDNIMVSFSGPHGPAIVRNNEKDNYLYVMVPLRTANS